MYHYILRKSDSIVVGIAYTDAQYITVWQGIKDNEGMPEDAFEHRVSYQLVPHHHDVLPDGVDGVRFVESESYVRKQEARESHRRKLIALGITEEELDSR